MSLTTLESDSKDRKSLTTIQTKEVLDSTLRPTAVRFTVAFSFL